MLKKVLSRVVHSSPFIERRYRRSLLNNKGRRFGDKGSVNFHISHVVSSIIYTANQFGRLNISDDMEFCGQQLDCYA